MIVDQILPYVDEIVERVLLVHHLALIVPRAAHLLAAADVGDGVAEAAIEQTENTGVKSRFSRRAVRSISVLEQRMRAILLPAFAYDPRQRHHHAVARLHHA